MKSSSRSFSRGPSVIWHQSQSCVTWRQRSHFFTPDHQLYRCATHIMCPLPNCPTRLMIHFRRDLWRNMLPGELVWLLFECISVTVFTFYFIFGEMDIRCFVGNIVTSSRQISGLCFSSLKSPIISPTLF